MIRVYYADVSPLENDILFNAAIGSLPPQRRKKAESLIKRSARNLSVGASLVLMHALNAAGYDAHSLEFATQKGGKPYIRNADIHFGITHSGTLAMCAAADSVIGIDAEEITDFNPDICKRFFSKAERKQIFASGDDDKIKDTFFRIWTMKESYVKMTGRGLGEFSAFEVMLYPDAHIKGGEICQIKELQLHGYKVSLCAQQDDDISFERINIIKPFVL